MYRLKNCLGIPKIITFGETKYYNILIEPLLGENLYNLFVKNKNNFTLKDICLIALQCLNRLESIHAKRIIHCDMYRISTEEDLCNILYFDFLKDLDSIMLVEWSENILEFLPKEYFSIKIEILDEEKRKIIIKREKGTE